MFRLSLKGKCYGVAFWGRFTTLCEIGPADKIEVPFSLDAALSSIVRRWLLLSALQVSAF
jgi:hypothetical protein